MNDNYPVYKSNRVIGDVHFGTKDKIAMMLGKESPLKDKLKMLKKIKDSLPGSHDSSESIKKFLDKYYYDIVDCVLIAEKGGPFLRKEKFSLAPIVGILSGCAVACFGSGILPVAGGLSILVLSCILPIAYSFIVNVRKSKFVADADDLFKIRSSLRKINTAQLPDKYKHLIDELIILVNGVETELRTYKENTDELIEMKLKVHEAFVNGAITESQRDMLLATVPTN